MGRESKHGGEASLVLPDLSAVSFLGGIRGNTPALGGHPRVLRGARLRPGDLPAAEEPASPQVDARDLGAHLRDVQDVPHHAGKVHPDARGFDRNDHRLLLRRPRGPRRFPGRDDPGVLPHWNRRQLRRRMVWHSRKYIRQFPHRVCQPEGKTVSGVRDSAARGHEHRDAPHQRRAGDDAGDPPVRPRGLCGNCFIGFAIGESLGASALRIAGGSSPRSPTSAPIS